MVLKTTPVAKGRNLGPVASLVLAEIGITTVEQIISKGWEQVAIELITMHPRYLNLNMLRALIGATLDIDWRYIPPEELAKAQTLLQTLEQKR